MSRDPRFMDPRYGDFRYVFGLNGFENQLYPYFYGPSFGSFVRPPAQEALPATPASPPALPPATVETLPSTDPWGETPPAPSYDPYAYDSSADASAMPTAPTGATPSPGDVSSAFFLATSPLTTERTSAARPSAYSPEGARPAAPSGGSSPGRVQPPTTSGCASCGALPPRTAGLAESRLGHGEPYGGPIAVPGIGDLGSMVRRLPLPGQVTADAATFLPSSQGGAGWTQVGAMVLPSPRSERRRGVVPPGVFGPLLPPSPFPRFSR